MSDDIPEQLTALGEGAAHLHEMYIAYIDAGFPEVRAFDLITTILMHYLDEE